MDEFRRLPALSSLQMPYSIELHIFLFWKNLRVLTFDKQNENQDKVLNFGWMKFHLFNVFLSRALNKTELHKNTIVIELVNFIGSINVHSDLMLLNYLIYD